jgi:putative phosphonate metabolism protein
MAARYAIYYVPAADSALYRFGAAALGYDAYSGDGMPYLDGVDAAVWPALTREPRVYGFHATMKPPMRLKDGVAEDDLVAAFGTFAGEQAPVDAGTLVVRELGSFIALVPAAPCAPLSHLADACVVAFDSFRALPTEQELAKRLKPGLTERHIEHLYRWGYPYVFEDFRFHMTLTGSLPVQKRTAASKFLCNKFEKIPEAAGLKVDRLVISRQPAPGAPFVVLREAALGGQA